MGANLIHDSGFRVTKNMNVSYDSLGYSSQPTNGFTNATKRATDRLFFVRVNHSIKYESYLWARFDA